MIGGCVALACAASARAESGACLVLSQPLGAGDYLASRHVQETPCRADAAPPPLAYDAAARATVATQPMARGAYLGRVLLDDAAIAKAGEALNLLVRSGPVIVEREVRPLRAVRAGGQALVRTADGEVIDARFVAMEGRQ